MLGPFEITVKTIVKVEILEVKRRFGRLSVLVRTTDGKETWMHAKDTLGIDVNLSAKGTDQ